VTITANHIEFANRGIRQLGEVREFRFAIATAMSLSRLDFSGNQERVRSIVGAIFVFVANSPLVASDADT
jgi:hypothetical protein